MKRFAALYARLDDTRATLAKVEAMRDYFAQAPPADAAWGLYFLTGNRLKRLIAPTRLRAWIAEATGLAPEVIEESYAHVGDLAETLALLLDRPGKPVAAERGLADWVAWLLALKALDEPAQRDKLLDAWSWLPMDECFLFNKLLTGSLRVGVSSGLAARALAAHAGLDVNLVAQRLMGEWRPSADNYATLIEPGAGAAANPSQPYPFCLASPLEDSPGRTVEALGAPSQFLVEWKWDGIRAQLIRREGQVFIWSRGEELLNGRFPEIEAAALAALPEGCVLDGEVLACNEAGVLPFATLQRRIGRKTLGKKLLAEAPVAFLAYDLLEAQGEDRRTRPLSARRAELEALLPCSDDDLRLRISPKLAAEDWPTLAASRSESRARGVEGLMLKRLDSPYQTGRKRGAWWKWKIDPMTVDCVLVYAQAGHGRRANLYSDYTLAVWDQDALVPVAKAYSGLTDAELTMMDAWIKRHTREKFGPVRSVDPEQVFEIAFEGIQASPRHKAGIALRFPRILRWRRDKTAAEADTLATMKRLLPP